VIDSHKGRVRCKRIEIFRKTIAVAVVGDNVGLMFEVVSGDDVKRGDIARIAG
jgi:translation elongation factor EF-Tu-like GTPase